MFSLGRPEIIDIDAVRNNDNKTNLEQAFSIAEKEFGVTRLLDCEGMCMKDLLDLCKYFNR